MRKREKQLEESLVDMVVAAKMVIANWSQGDLANAVNELEVTMENAEALLENGKR